MGELLTDAESFVRVDDRVEWAILREPPLLIVRLRGNVLASDLVRALQLAGSDYRHQPGMPSLTDCREQVGSLAFEELPSVMSALVRIHRGLPSRAAVVVASGIAMMIGEEFASLDSSVSVYMTTEVAPACRWLGIDPEPIVALLDRAH